MRDIKGDDRLRAYFSGVVEFLKSASTEERHLKLDELTSIDVSLITRFGFTDMAMFELSLSRGTKLPILTDELELTLFAAGKIPIIKFEHIRTASISASLA